MPDLPSGKVKMKRRSFSRRASSLEREIRAQLDAMVKMSAQIEDLKKRVDDLEYFKENARVLLDIQDVQDS